jgi:hypothetical protein
VLGGITLLKIITIFGFKSVEWEAQAAGVPMTEEEEEGGVGWGSWGGGGGYEAEVDVPQLS